MDITETIVIDYNTDIMGSSPIKVLKDITDIIDIKYMAITEITVIKNVLDFAIIKDITNIAIMIYYTKIVGEFNPH
jgi:hypothetical protein